MMGNEEEIKLLLKINNVDVLCFIKHWLSLIAILLWAFTDPQTAYDLFEIVIEEVLIKLSKASKKIRCDFNINLLDNTSTTTRFITLFKIL